MDKHEKEGFSLRTHPWGGEKTTLCPATGAHTRNAASHLSRESANSAAGNASPPELHAPALTHRSAPTAHNAVHASKWLLFSLQKEYDSDTCCHMAEPPKHHAKRIS